MRSKRKDICREMIKKRRTCETEREFEIRFGSEKENTRSPVGRLDENILFFNRPPPLSPPEGHF